MDQDRYYEEYEIDLRQYIKLLWNSKWFIMGLIIVAVLCVGAYNRYFIEPEYEAKSTLLILPSIYTTSLEAPSFPIDTYVNLAQTDAIKGQIIDELGLKSETGKPLSIAGLDGMLEVEVLARETTVDQETYKVPLMTFKVRGNEPEKIANIANVWADNFIEDSKSMRKSEVQEVSSVINEQFQDTKTKLNQAKEKLREFREETRLGLAQDQLKNMESKLSNYNQKILDLRMQIGSERARYNELDSKVSGLETEGRWVGEMFVEEPDDNVESREKLLVIDARESYYQAQQEILNFKKENNLELLEQQIEDREEIISNYYKNMSELEARLQRYETENKMIASLLEEEAENWEIERSMSEDSLWENILNPEQIDILQDMKLTDELVNPVYEKLKLDQTENIVGTESLPDRIGYYRQQIEEEEEELTEIRAELAQKKQKLELLDKNLDHYLPIYENYSKKYYSLVSGRIDSMLKIDSLQAQIEFYEEARAELEEEIKESQNSIWKSEIRKEELIQQIDDYQQTYEKLAEKREEARITEAQRTSDVKFVAEALPPTRPLSRNMQLNMAIAAVLALMSGVFIVFFREFLQEDEDAEISG